MATDNTRIIPSMDFTTLGRLPLEELEALYRGDEPPPMPSGLFRAVHLGWVDNWSARRRRVRAGLAPLFVLPPFGIDFRSRRWWFYYPRLQAGSFIPTPGPSRWRDAQVLRMTYDVSRLPRPLRSRLYDEIKPLSADLCLGMGGVNYERGRGDLFFFGMERVE